MSMMKSICLAGAAALLSVAAIMSPAGAGAGETPPVATPPANTPAYASAFSDAPPARDRAALLQVGPWYPATFNVEEAFINIIHASAARWSGGDLKTQQLYDQGYLDKTTGLPISLPGGKTLTTDVYFSAGRNPELKTHWDGEWVLDWEGDADLTMLYLPKELMRRVGKNRIEFTRDAANGRTPYHAAIQVTRIKTPVRAMRMYRKKFEAAQRDGKIFNPDFAAAVARYDVVRTMDLQGQNVTAITSIDDNATMAAPYWSNTVWKSADRTHQPFRSVPIEAMFALSMETETSLWFQAPITLGAPVQYYDPTIVREKDNLQAEAYRNLARESAASIVASAEWDRYADHFVRSLIESGYPKDRPIYVALANEVWNFAGQYYLTTQYASGVGEGLAEQFGWRYPTARYGYGVLSARFKLAVDAALKRADRTQAIVYVIEGQAGNPATTTAALTAAKDWLEKQGEPWSRHAPAFGVSVASYWAAKWEKFLTPEAWPAAIASDPEGTASRFAEFIRSNPSPYGVKWAIDVATKHQRAATIFGVKFIGAYEGGSHLSKPRYVPDAWYRDFLWGEHGASINRANNDAFAKAFPGTILSNYGLAGAVGGQPWFEGPLGADNPYAHSWEPYMRR